MLSKERLSVRITTFHATDGRTFLGLFSAFPTNSDEHSTYLGEKKAQDVITGETSAYFPTPLQTATNREDAQNTRYESFFCLPLGPGLDTLHQRPTFVTQTWSKRARRRRNTRRGDRFCAWYNMRSPFEWQLHFKRHAHQRGARCRASFQSPGQR